MDIVRWMGRGLLVFVASLCITLWITLFTLQMTLFNRTVVLGWLEQSGAYEHVVDSVISLQHKADGQQETILSESVLRQAVGKTLTPAYIKQTTETVLNTTYDWLEGKTEGVHFTVAMAEKRTDLQKNLAAALEPRLAQLPVCASNLQGLSATQESTCRPASASPQQMATSTAQQAVEGSNFLKEPFTEKAIAGTGQTLSMQWLPTLVQNFTLLAIGLPVLALLCGLGFVLLSKDRVIGGRALAGHVFFGPLLTLIVGALLWGFGGQINLTANAGAGAPVALLQTVVEPILHQVIPAVGAWLTLLAGVVVAISGGSWIALLIVGRRRKTMHAPPANPDLPDVPNAQTPEMLHNSQKKLQ